MHETASVWVQIRLSTNFALIFLKILKRNKIQCSNGNALLSIQTIKQRHTLCILVFYQTVIITLHVLDW